MQLIVLLKGQILSLTLLLKAPLAIVLCLAEEEIKPERLIIIIVIIKLKPKLATPIPARPDTGKWRRGREELKVQSAKCKVKKTTNYKLKTTN